MPAIMISVITLFLSVLMVTAQNWLGYNPETHLSTPQLVVKYGYPVETHTVLTADGYFLTLHRIPYGRKNNTRSRQPVLIQHGFLCSSADWVILGPEKAIGYILADAGYDVWLGNSRGNAYCRRHINFTSKNRKFWNFSFEEMGLFDLPAVFDYILKETGYQKLKYIGHSMGVTMFLILMSERPEYNEKIHVLIGLAPVAYISHAPSPVRDYSVSNGMEWLVRTMEAHGMFGFFPDTDLSIHMLRAACQDRRLARMICENIFFFIGGFGTNQFNTTTVPVIFGHTPSGTSTKVLLHFTQLMKNGRFCKFDYGAAKNREVYGMEKPPSYNLNNTKVPASLHYSDHDGLAPKTDAMKLYKELPNTIGFFRVPLHEFNHLDFMWGIDAKTLVYDSILDILNKY